MAESRKEIAVMRERALVDRVERMLPAVVVVSALTGFSVLAWYAYTTSTQSAQEEDLLIVEAEKTPLKEKPLDPGGMKFPNQDKTIFETFANGSQQTPKVERVLPTPEEPLPKNIDTSETQTWINERLHKNIDSVRADAALPDDSGTREQVIGYEGDGAVAKLSSSASMEDEALSVSEQQVAEKLKKAAEDAMKSKDIVSFKQVAESAGVAVAKPVHVEEPAPVEKPAPAEEPAPVQKPATVAEKVDLEVDADVKPGAPVELLTPVQKTAPAPTATGAFRVQLGAFQSEKEARGELLRIRKKFAVVAPYSEQIVRADLGAKGVFYRLRLTGMASAAAAKSLCAKLSAQGQPCLVPKD
jgi:hypothetical protein